MPRRSYPQEPADRPYQGYRTRIERVRHDLGRLRAEARERGDPSIPALCDYAMSAASQVERGIDALREGDRTRATGHGA